MMRLFSTTAAVLALSLAPALAQEVAVQPAPEAAVVAEAPKPAPHVIETDLGPIANPAPVPAAAEETSAKDDDHGAAVEEKATGDVKEESHEGHTEAPAETHTGH